MGEESEEVLRAWVVVVNGPLNEVLTELLTPWLPLSLPRSPRTRKPLVGAMLAALSSHLLALLLVTGASYGEEDQRQGEMPC